MEDSMNSSYMQQKPVSTKGTANDSPEESGWTAYFEDFSNNREQPSYCSSFDGSSLVSDAASAAAWKLSRNNHIGASPTIGGSPKIPKKLKFKKTRTKEICEDDSLEDTASSPVNSPKIGDLEPTDMNPRKTDHDHMYSSLGKGAASSEHYSETHTQETSMNFNGKNDCTDFKRRGLCLVPLSMLVNYLG